MTRETTASNAGPGHDRPERAPVCLAGEAGAADGTSTPGDSARQPLSDQERAAIRQAGADDARRSRAGQGFPERIEDPAAVAALAALLRDAPHRRATKQDAARPGQRHE